MGVRANIECFDGEDLLIPDVITVDGTTSGTPINVAGWTINLVVSAFQGGPAILTHPATIDSGPLGQIHGTLPSAETAAAGVLGIGDHWFRFERTDSGADAVLTYGTFSIKPK